MIPLKNLHTILRVCLTLSLFLSLGMAEAQTAPTISNNDGYKGTSAEKVKTKFIKPEIEIKKSGLISNVLKIINTGNDNLNFTLDVLIPNNWSSIINPNKTYNLQVNDTLVIPVIVVPSKLKSGNSSVIINSFILDLDGQQIGDNSFLIRTKKQVKWDIGLKTANRLYFKNEEFNKKFEYRIINKGNYKQDISINHKIPKKDLFVSDTVNIEAELQQKSKTISLDVDEEANFSYYASAIQLNDRNKKKISNTTYTPYQNQTYKKYDLVINSTEDKTSSEKIYKKTAKVSFVKLPNEIEMQPYGYPSLPLTMDMYIQNILGDYPFMSLNLRGIKQLSDDASLIYNTSLNFSQSYYNNQFIQDVPWYIGYFDDKKSLEIGQIHSNIIGIASNGRGLRGSYRINDHNSVSAFYTKSKEDPIYKGGQSYGFTHNFTSSIFNLRSQYGRSENNNINRFTDVITINPRLRLFKKHTFSFLASQSVTEDRTINQTRTGYLYGASIASTLTRRYKFNINARYTDPLFGAGGIERINGNHRSTYKFNSKWSVFLNNNYQNTITKVINNNFVYYENTTFNNRFNISKKTKFGSIQNGIYYDTKQYSNYEIKSRGLSYRVSTFNNQINLQSSFLARAGFTKQILNTPTDDHFSFDFTALTRYRIWNFTLKYNFGNFVFNPNQNTGPNDKTPQSFRVSAQNQYTFNNRRFVLETTSSYTYRNTANNNSFGISPELFYFSKTNWRFSLRTSYFYNSSNYSFLNGFEEETQYNTNKTGKSQSSNFTIGMSIRKEFGIPIPFTTKKSTNVKFIAFKDINGNGIKDYNETPLNNIVITLGPKEVITSNRGMAIINKAPHQKFKFKVLALEELNGWFPEVSDSIYIGKESTHYIPYVRGVKLYGDVILDRQKIAITEEGPMDLSRIKITASKENSYTTLTDDTGHFEFYLPNGDYTLTIDDGILSSNLRLSRNNIPIVLKNNQDGYYVSFYILEKRRKVIIRDFSKKKK